MSSGGAFQLEAVTYFKMTFFTDDIPLQRLDRLCSLSAFVSAYIPYVRICASCPSPSQCSILGVCAGRGGRAEQWCCPFHPQLQRGSVVEEIPATTASVQTLPALLVQYNPDFTVYL
ncbi:hypothetical protein Q5P01_001147 [Channa striata]|uniref:Uncharacterized protein n=1 Tax=Channa striata TaxID=64152 RepID=A0AA88NP22_CHASR|nr:hypothetical protein Q5P01_001147 [Channa striata]